MEDPKSNIYLRPNLTDFEKRLFLEYQVKELQKLIKQKNYEIGVLKSDIDYLKECKETSAIFSLREENKNLRAKIRKIKDDNLVILSQYSKIIQKTQ